jgi:hypothetical protein
MQSSNIVNVGGSVQVCSYFAPPSAGGPPPPFIGQGEAVYNCAVLF